jgi:dienelactone hydrolase
MFIERTNYVVKPGCFDAMVAARREASRVRVGLGLDRGTIWTKQNDDHGGPDVTWECRFRNIEDQQRDLAARDGSAEFEAVRARVGDLVERFERQVFQVDGGAADDWTGDVDLVDLAIVPQAVAVRSGGRNLAGFLYLPPGPGPFPCMITNHGSTINQGTTDLCRPGTASLLMSWGIASLLVHRRGYGESPGAAWDSDVSAPFGSDDYDTQLAIRLDRESDDVLAALDFAVARPEINAGHIGVMGSSFGGTVSLLASAKTERFRCTVEFAGAAMNWERTPGLRQSMIDATARLTAPIYFLQAATDYSVAPTIELAAAMADSAAEVRSKVFPAFGLSNDEGHFFERSGPMIWGPEIRRFLERWL